MRAAVERGIQVADMRRWRTSSGWIVVSVFGLWVGCAGRPGEDAEHDPAHAADAANPELERLDAELARGWAAAKLEPGPIASDAEFLRRVSLDLIGRVPNRAELERFRTMTMTMTGGAPDKRARVVDELLASEAFAEHWAQLWADRLLPGDKRAQRQASEPLESYLSQALADNRRWDVVVDELLTGEGMLDDNPALAYLGARALRGANKQDALAELSSTTARVFLGARIECAQCHDHPYVSGFSREDFWAQTAYFGRTAVKLDRQSDQPKAKRRVQVIERPRGQLRVALGGDEDARERALTPRFMGADAASFDPERPRRAQLARAIVDDPRFAEATAGWVWTQLIGRGIVEPWDELLADTQRPALLALLATEFRASEHDLRALLRTIVLSSAYQRSSAGATPGATPSQIAEAEAAFARASVRPLSAEQLFASLMTATELEHVDERRFRRAVRAHKQKALREYEFAFTDDEMSSADGFSGNVPQALLLLNGSLTNNGVVSRLGGSLDRILSTSEDTDARLQDLWLTVYARAPRAEELALGREAVAGGHDADWEDLMFAMLCSSEFTSNH